MGTVEDYYNCQYDEWGRLERHRLEFEITKMALDEYIPGKSSVLDVGGGPGRYSIYLAQKGHRVTLVDLSQRHIEQAGAKSVEAGAGLEACIRGDVLLLDRLLSGKAYDVVLCMGPLYHLLEESERKEAVRQCLGRLKAGGVLVVSFISAFAPVVDCLKSFPQEIEKWKDRFLHYLSDGKSEKTPGFTDAHFMHPAGMETFMSAFELEACRIMAVESLGAMVEEKLMQLPEADFKKWLDLFYRIAGDRVTWGACEHLLYIGKKVG